MGLEINAIIIGTLSGLIGSIIGALLGPYLSHRLSIKRIKEELLLKEKLEYFKDVTKVLSKKREHYCIIRKILREPIDEINLLAMLHNLTIAKNLNPNIEEYLLYSNRRSFLEHLDSFLEYESQINLILKRRECNPEKETKLIEELIQKVMNLLVEMRKELEN